MFQRLAFSLVVGVAIASLALSCDSGGGNEVPPPVTKVTSLASSCRAPSPSSAFHLEDAFPGVTVDRPTSITNIGGDVFFLTEQSGRVVRISRSGDHFTRSVVLDISHRIVNSGEMGLLGIAVSPAFATSGEFFITYTARATTARASLAQTVLGRFVSHDGGLTAQDSSEEVLLRIQRDIPNHNGGRVVFGPDRNLYVSIGDGSWGDPKNRVQNPYELFGKMLRLDVLGGHPYRIPDDNPYAKGGGAPEVYALGFRNPWTFSFDDQGRLWLGDVGNDRYEEVDVVTKGGNYGWPLREGRHCLRTAPCDLPGATDPIFEYPHVDGFAITGGAVYRGKKLALKGQYVFSDFMTGRVWSLDPNAPATSRLLFDSGLFVSNFGEDADGELLMLDFGGHVMRIEASAASADPGPLSLRGLGCLDGTSTEVASGMLPYDVRAPLWSDGLAKRRWVSLPEGSKIHVRDDASWDFPAGALFLKEFASGGKRIETRMLVRDAESGWLGYTFQWNDAQTDAVLLTEGKDVPVTGGTWSIPSRAQCLTCHSANADHVLGFNAAQLNHNVSLDDGTQVNQITRLDALAALDQTVHAVLAPSFPDPSGTEGTIEERARAYLNINCSTCHRPAVGASYGLDMRAVTPTDMMNLVCRPPSIDDLGIKNALLIAPAEPDRSILYQRMASSGDSRMPRIGSHRVDDAGLAAIRSWIMSLPPCP